MKIVCAGGGSGGHVTPVLAVINELSRKDPNLEVWFITERRFAPQAKDIMFRAKIKVPIKVIFAGKIRRYVGVPMWRQLLHLPTQLYNLRDLFYLIIGFISSLLFLIKTRPDVVFTKGGFVCVPVGVTAKLLGLPLVIHDSDTAPGLTNKLLSRWAAAIATGTPLENYPYPKERSYYIGIPVDKAYRPIESEEQRELKIRLNYPDNLPMILVTGGSLGAKRINDLIVSQVANIKVPAQIVHITGAAHLNTVQAALGKREHYQTIAFTGNNLPDLVRAADIVIARAGATTLLELAASAKPVVIIPHPNLPGAHQTKNAEVYEKTNAAVVLTEDDLTDQPELLAQTLDWLLEDTDARSQLSENIFSLARPNAAAEMAELIISKSKNR